jgi:TonB-dependent starch-binding outer membrane protein SusC
MFVLLLGSVQALAQKATVTGRVTSNDDGSGLPGVSILEKGTTTGTVSDAEGNYSVAVSQNAVLVFSFVGYTTQEVEVSGRTSLNITLESDVTALSEIVVIGYGEVQKKDATGAIANISTKEFNKGVIASPQDLLLGKLAGVSVISNSGAPGAETTIRIRGGSSLSASNDPLIVIDGFPVDNSTVSGISNPLAAINPNDIESFTVLKDASATAIYGSRASNGVIIVTTKKGKSGKPQFSYNATLSSSSVAKSFDVMSGDEYRALVNDLKVDGVSGINDEAVEKLGDQNTDWQKEIYQTAFSQDHNISAAGGISNTTYRLSYGYTDQEGILKTTGFKRHSINLNTSTGFLDDDLKISINAKGSIVDNNFGETDAVGHAITYDPTRPVYSDDPRFGGYYSWLSDDVTNGTSNPVAELMQTDNTARAKRIIGNIQVDYRLPFLPELKLTINGGLDLLESEGHDYAPENAEFTKVVSEDEWTLQGRKNTYDAKNRSELLDMYFNYLKEFGDHKIDLTGGYGWQYFKRENNNYNSNTAGTVTSYQGGKNENYLISFFGRLNYTYKGKYLLTGTLRQDGSSRFADHWSLFPSVAAAWRVKDETFLSNVEVLSDLKFRAGYGVTGQQDLTLNQYPYLALYRTSTSTAQYQLGNQFYYTFRPQAYDANIKWEETTTINAGVDFGFWNDRLTGSVEVYKRTTDDLLNYIGVASGTNFSNFIDTNVGNLENKGIEVTLKANVIKKQDLNWNIGFNLARNVNEITKLTLVDDPSYPGVSAGNIGVDAFIQNQQVGYPINSFYVYQQVYDNNKKPIEGLYVNRSGSSGEVVGDVTNKYRYKSPAPRVLMGINTQLAYKKFDFSFSGRLSLGNYIYNSNMAQRSFYNRTYDLGYFSNVPASINETGFVSQQTYSDYYIQDGSFFKMDNMSLGYNLEKIFTDKLKGRISITGQNVFVITDYNGIDPEVHNGIDNGIYPRPRTFLLGLNLNF